VAVYAVGDIQGCYDPLQRLLEVVHFDPARDQLWSVGDLVNRGPASLSVLRLVRSLGTAAVTVLGNHDLHLLAVAYHRHPIRPKDTLEEVLRAPDCAELMEWLRALPLLHHAPHLGVTMVHAGFPPQWDLTQAQSCAQELHEVLSGPCCEKFFAHMYGDRPHRWNANLSGWERLRFSMNCLTRIRFCTADGQLDLEAKGPPGSQRHSYLPWFQVPNRRTARETIVFGHWSALGEYHQPGIHALDSGCVWSGRLTALRIDDGTFRSISVSCATRR